jgi:hypothetical protein
MHFRAHGAPDEKTFHKHGEMELTSAPNSMQKMENIFAGRKAHALVRILPILYLEKAILLISKTSCPLFTAGRRASPAT